MIRKIMLSAVLAVTALSGLTMTAGNVAANPPGYRHDAYDRRDHGERFEVLYHNRNHWDCFGTYRDHNDAERAAQQLRHQGYNVKIERERC